MHSPESEPLSSLQRRLLAYLTGDAEPDAATSGVLFRQPPRGTIAERWHIYGAGYFARLGEALENDYPALRRIVGHEAFDSMVRRYALAYPPRSHDLGRVGDRLSRFLETDWLSTKLPFLPDLARLEWALAEAFVSKDARALHWDDLQTMDPESVSEMPLKLMPGTVVIRSNWPLIELWECKDRSDREISLQVEDRPSNVLVFRRGYQAHCAEASETMARFVEAVAACGGTSLLGVQEALGADGDPAAIDQILGAFRRMVGEGHFVNPTQ